MANYIGKSNCHKHEKSQLRVATDSRTRTLNVGKKVEKRQAKSKITSMAVETFFELGDIYSAAEKERKAVKLAKRGGI